MWTFIFGYLAGIATMYLPEIWEVSVKVSKKVVHWAKSLKDRFA